MLSLEYRRSANGFASRTQKFHENHPPNAD
jgi:hypothetical protein